MPLREAFGLDLHTTKLVKDEIDNNADLPHKYFVSLAWSPAEVCRMWSELQDKMSAPKKVIEAALDDWKMNQAHKFVVELARDTNSHIQAYSGLHEPTKEHIHFHTILCSEKPLSTREIMNSWKYCNNMSKDVKIYDPNYLGVLGNAVTYVMHIHRPIPNQGKVYCPKKLRACRKGKCKHTGGNILQRTQ